ncbi:hypothetical protein [Dysgonomonas sp. 25]|uniref:hypothetical protein n=1 Tax=Dysgonomonas sp. 25 TaxID=2302933 RepID=UPI0013D370A4|nr:hypothetical protein [Dysgonomonas sp. 25]NDV68568.1 hypothetical protein [Dysgonomonas sp. 25]
MDETILINYMRKIRKKFRFTAVEQALFYELLAIHKSDNSEIIYCSNTELTDRLNIAESSLYTARKNLIKAGIIVYQVGRSTRSVGQYSFKKDTISDTTPDTLFFASSKGLNETPSPKKARGKTFIPPTFEEVQAYCLERKNTIDPQKFIDFYSAKGWMIGKNKMKDWKAAIRTWEQSRKNNENRSDFSKPKDYGKGF